VNKPVVVIADDNEPMRERLCRLLSPTCRIAGTAAGGAELISVCRDHRPEVAISDIMMPGVSGLEVLRLLREELPAIKVIFVTGLLDASVIEEAMRGGAAGFVAKCHAAEDLPVALEEVLRGRSFVSPACARRV
jgi:DNA-binding NarL/FixJ family response regulator